MKIDLINPAMERELGDLVENFPPERVRAAITAAALHEVSSPLPYIRAVVMEKGKEKEKPTAEGKFAFEHAPHVFLTESEVLKLVKRFGSPGAEARIEEVSLYKGSTGKVYESDYQAILLWDRRGNPDNTPWEPEPPDWHIKQEWLDSLQPKPDPLILKSTFETYGNPALLSYFVICGYTGNLGSLVIGLPVDGKLQYCGAVGGGLRKRDRREELYTALKGIEMEKSPFLDEVEIIFKRYPGQITWVQPTLVAQVKFGQFTRRCRLTTPVFRGLRRDLRPEDLSGVLEKLKELEG